MINGIVGIWSLVGLSFIVLVIISFLDEREKLRKDILDGLIYGGIIGLLLGFVGICLLINETGYVKYPKETFIGFLIFMTLIAGFVFSFLYANLGEQNTPCRFIRTSLISIMTLVVISGLMGGVFLSFIL